MTAQSRGCGELSTDEALGLVGPFVCFGGELGRHVTELGDMPGTEDLTRMRPGEDHAPFLYTCISMSTEPIVGAETDACRSAALARWEVFCDREEHRKEVLSRCRSLNRTTGTAVKDETFAQHAADS